MSGKTYAANEEFLNKFKEFANGPSPETVAKSTYLNLMSALTQGIEKAKSEIRDLKSTLREHKDELTSVYFNKGERVTSEKQTAYLNGITEANNKIRKIESQIRSFDLTIKDYEVALDVLKSFGVEQKEEE